MPQLPLQAANGEMDRKEHLRDEESSLSRR